MNLKSISLYVKLLVILSIPLLLFRYVDSQPTIVIETDDNEGTREIAIVNEDNGTDLDEEVMKLGNEISALLNDKESEYKWTVLGRSTAEQGFRNKIYDAILFIPSDFSDNIMTFKDEYPKEANLNYVVQPYLDAKNRHRVHREMALANNTINENMSTIYWNYVSQEIKNIREHFDNILEKEIAFQKAMYSFYAPSSKKLADEIKQHQNVLENILEQTATIDETSKDYIGVSKEAEKEMTLFANALGEYKEAQQTQQQLLDKFLVSHKEAINEGLNVNDEFVKQGLSKFNVGFNNQLNKYTEFNQTLNGYFTDIRGTIQQNERELKTWSQHTDRIYANQERYLERILIDFSEDYLNQLFERNNEQSVQHLQEAILSILDAEIPEELTLPIKPEDENVISFRELQKALSQLGREIDLLKNKLTPREEGDDEEEYEKAWEDLLTQYQLTEKELEQLIEDYNNDEVLENWKEYSDELLNLNQKLERFKDNIKEKVSKEIITLQNKISNYYKRIDEEKYRDLLEQFQQVESLIEKRYISDLIDYMQSLTKHDVVLEQKLHVDRELILKIINNNEKIKENKGNMLQWYQTNQAFEKRLQNLLGIPENFTKQDENQIEISFTSLVQEAEKTLETYNEDLTHTKENMNELVESLLEETNHILNNIKEDNSQMFDWEESPALLLLDERIPVSIHEGSKLSLERLSDLVQSLNDNQERMVNSMADLQTKVEDVQKESDDLNDRWDQNVRATKQIQDDVYDVLGNTIIDGQYNPLVYNHLANPVNVEGKVRGKVQSKTEERFPPVVLLIIILISGLLIGFVSNYYSRLNYYVQCGLFVLLNLAVGLIISIYSANLYELNDAQAIKWFILTLLLLLVTSNIIRSALFIHTFVGWLASIAMIIFFVTPLINIAVPEFEINNPIANVYIGLQYNINTSYSVTIIILTVIVLLISMFVYSYQILKDKGEKENQDDTMAS